MHNQDQGKTHTHPTLTQTFLIFDCVIYCGTKLFIVSKKFRGHFKKHSGRRGCKIEEYNVSDNNGYNVYDTYNATFRKKQAVKGLQHYL